MLPGIVTIHEADINLVCELEVYSYKKTMEGIVSPQKRKEFKILRDKMQILSDHYKEKYDKIAGIFQSDRATGNPISFYGKLRRVWSGLYKGSENKQYSAQISFVINTKQKCLDVGFYFGRTSSFKIAKAKRIAWESEITALGRLLYDSITNNEQLQKCYSSLFDYGFKAEIKGERVTSEEWLSNLLENPTNSSINFSLSPNNGVVDIESIDLYVAMVMPLIAVLPERVSQASAVITKSSRKVKPLSPEQRAKQAEKRALIGLRGEQFIMKLEGERLKGYGINIEEHLFHQSIISDGFGYDILSCDNKLNELFIEVKTTTLLKEEKTANTFFISAKEYNFYENNKVN